MSDPTLDGMLSAKKLETYVITLADLRKGIGLQELFIEDSRKELYLLAPKLVDQIDGATANLTRLRKETKECEIAIREFAVAYSDIADKTPWLKRHFPTVVDVAERLAIRLALIFFPSAVKLDKKAFDKWAIANKDNPLLVGVSIEKVPGYTINSDLSEYESKPETIENIVEKKPPDTEPSDNDWLALGLNQDEPPDKMDDEPDITKAEF